MLMHMHMKCTQDEQRNQSVYIEKSSNNNKLSGNKVKNLKTSLIFRFDGSFTLVWIDRVTHMDSTKPLNNLSNK